MAIQTDQLIERAAQLVLQAEAVVIAAGAGMGVDSGLPDFRGTQGFWRAYPALARAGIAFESVANPRTFVQDPTLAWGFYGHRLNLYRDTTPHAGFGLLQQWVARKPLGHHIYTSNVDGHFKKAGFLGRHLTECHGSILHLQCMKACPSGVWRADDFVPLIDDKEGRLINEPPCCPVCGGMARPNILMFGDGAWCENRQSDQHARQVQWLSQLEAGVSKVLVIELGAGTAIPSVRNFSHAMCRVHGARLIRINPREPQVRRERDIGLAMGALAGLQAIDAAMSAQRASRG